MPVSNCRPRSGRRGVRIVALKPRVYVEQIGLLRPEQACECLSLYEFLIRGGFRRVGGCVEFIRLRLPVADHFIYPIERSVDALRREPQTQNNEPPGGTLYSYCRQAFVPVCSGFTAFVSPSTIARWNASLT